MNNILKIENCTNCMACVNICPKQALDLKEDDLFYKIEINETKCINCGLCLRTCPINNLNPNLNVIAAYGGWTTDKSIVKTSSSGGAFTVLADYILEKGGVVFGAAYSEDFRKVYISNTEETSIENIKRSKYVESIVGDSFQKVKYYLMCDRYVLFCGTPCQVAGLKKYLGAEYEKLVTIDFACGGLASHMLYKSRLTYLEKRYNSKICNVNFRPGSYGWSRHAIKVEFENGKKYDLPAQFDPYTYSFLYIRSSIRDNCLDCKFRENHYSDFIIADFWKWKDCSSLHNDESGISLILINSFKAKHIFDDVKDNMYLEEIEIENAKYNCYKSPVPTKEYLAQREKFLSCCKEKGLTVASKQQGMKSGLNAFIRKTKIVWDAKNEKKE